MEGESNPMRALCRSGCGFFSNPSMDGLCSLCYKEALKKKQQPPNQVQFEGAAASADPEATGEVETALPTVSTPEKETEAGGSSDGAKGGKDGKDGKKKNRCASCRKKVGLTGFDCRCGGLYCAVHRYSDKHACTFNYRETGAQEIRRNNPVVVSEKIQKI